MKKVLLIETSPRGQDSLSRQVGRKLIDRLKSKGPIELIERDLQQKPIPHVDAVKMSAYFTPVDQLTAEQKSSVALSDSLTDEVLASEVIVISTPMWNFSLPSVLKAWIDHIVRAGKTFKFGPNGVEGMLEGKQVYIVFSSGSVFSSGPFHTYDYVAPYFKTIFGFMGVKDIQIVRIEGTNDPETASKALKNAFDAVAEL